MSKMMDNTDKKNRLDSLTREELMEMIQQKFQKIAEQATTIVQLTCQIAEQASVLTKMSSQEQGDQDRKMLHAGVHE
jgi:hypothetical protein